MREWTTSVLFVITIGVEGQCGMTTTIVGDNGCSSGSITVNSTGGQGPYSISIKPTPWDGITVLSFINDADGDVVASIPHYPANGYQTWYSSYSATVTVTDVNSCTASATAAFWCRIDTDPVNAFGHQVDCTTGLSTVQLLTYPATGAPPSYTMTSSSGYFSSGVWSSGWGSVGNSTWSYSPQLPNGTYTLSTPQWMSGGTCAMGGIINCAGGATWTIGDNVTAGDCGGKVRLLAALDGPTPLGGGLMADSLRTHGLVPTMEPYSALGYTYTGMSPGATMNAALLSVTGGNAIVDWVVVELRNSANNGQVMFSRPALLQRDGDVMDLDGDGYVNFPGASGSYFVAIRHRNHLSVMTGSAWSASTVFPQSAIDFRSSGTSAYGSTPRMLKGSTYCLWAGDANGDGSLKYTGSANDRDPIILAIGGTTPNNTVSNVYDRRDTNLDGVIKYTGSANDRDIILTNVGSTTPNNTRTQQLP
jgi:hypothetical protein